MVIFQLKCVTRLADGSQKIGQCISSMLLKSQTCTEGHNACPMRKTAVKHTPNHDSTDPTLPSFSSNTTTDPTKHYLRQAPTTLPAALPPIQLSITSITVPSRSLAMLPNHAP